MHDSLCVTKQRKIILEELYQVNTHPTAFERCQMVCLPHFSLGAIHCNLQTLSQWGDTNKI